MGKREDQINDVIAGGAYAALLLSAPDEASASAVEDTAGAVSLFGVGLGAGAIVLAQGRDVLAIGNSSALASMRVDSAIPVGWTDSDLPASGATVGEVVAAVLQTVTPVQAFLVGRAYGILVG